MTNSFGNYLTELRGERSLREMERITGLSHTYLSTLEKGIDPRTDKERLPSLETLDTLSRTLKIDFAVLMEKVGFPQLQEKHNENDQLRKALEQVMEVEAPIMEGWETTTYEIARQALGISENECFGDGEEK
ncbi:helix-turn-helix domain-containing protein [Lysinibacillus sp. UGB7]|uniref:helix-turn-helix domain-containing protein n=1 Tax=Lysinibacillus sp. UGB7 TaxID=3411039 RepID=UPI003B7F66C9